MIQILRTIPRNNRDSESSCSRLPSRPCTKSAIFCSFPSLSDLPRDLSEGAAHITNLPNSNQSLDTLQGEPGVQAQPRRIGGATEKKRVRGEAHIPLPFYHLQTYSSSLTHHQHGSTNSRTIVPIR